MEEGEEEGGDAYSKYLKQLAEKANAEDHIKKATEEAKKRRIEREEGKREVHEAQEAKPKGPPPNNARRLVIAGASLSIVSIAIAILAGVVTYTGEYNNNAESILNGLLASIFYYSITILAVELALYVVILAAGIKLRGEPAKKSRSSKIVLAAALAVFAVSYSSSIILNGQSISSLPSALISTGSVLSYSGQYSTALQSTLSILLSIALPLMAISFILVVIGGIHGLAESAGNGFFDYLYENAKIVAVIAILVAALYIGNLYRISSDNHHALEQLNSKINAYGGNLRYMLANRSEFLSSLGNSSFAQEQSGALYKNLSIIGNSIPSLSYLIAYPNATSMASGGNSSPYDWLSDSYFVRGLTIAALAYFGLSVVNKYANNANNASDTIYPGHYRLLIPQKASNLESMYELESTGYDIYAIAIVLGNMASENYFSPSPGAKTGKISSIGFAQEVCPLGSNPPNAGYTSMLSNCNFYDAASLGNIPDGWLNLIYTAYGSSGMAVNSTSFSKALYGIALLKYLGYLDAQILYNKTIPPEIDFIGYQNGTLLLDLGNLNLTNPDIELLVDGRGVDYSRYWDFLIAKTNLSIGMHSIYMRVDGRTLSENIAVYPTIISDPYYGYAGNLSFSISDPYNYSIEISNVSVSYGIPSFPYILPENLTGALLGNVTLRSMSLEPISMKYYKPLGYTTIHNNLTKSNFTFLNYSHYSISGSSFTLNSLDKISFVYGNVPQDFGTLGYFTVKYNTSLGRGYGIISGMAI